VDVSGASGRDPVSDLDTVRRELEMFQPALAAKPQIVAANKIDAVSGAAPVDLLKRRAAELKLPFFAVSGVTGAGVAELLDAMWQRLAAARQPAA
jgi:GTP-binding protein